MTIEPIGYFRSPLTSKFGIPRQSGIVDELRGTVVLTGDYRTPDALRGLDSFDYLWLIWGFSENEKAKKSPTVRPPRLGGNERLGVFSTRSPFRPNNLGLSSVRIVNVDFANVAIDVSGADLMDGTPIFDIKPYVAFSDSHPQAHSGFVDSHNWKRLEVVMTEATERLLGDDANIVRSLIAEDPRPQYHDDPMRIYGMAFGSMNIKFRVDNGVAYIVNP